MPQYEIMYILSSQVVETDEPELTKSIADFITSTGGTITREEKLGKKRLAYPIKKTRNGFYVMLQFTATSDKLKDIEHKVRVTQGVVRYLIINLDEQIKRMTKDREERKSFKSKPVDTTKHKPKKAGVTPAPEIKIDLDKQIEQALEEDLTKKS